MEELNESIKAFWEIETVEDNIPVSDELSYCDEHFQKTHYRNSERRYVVQLPFRPNIAPDNISLSDSKSLAVLRLEQLWRRLDRDPEMK